MKALGRIRTVVLTAILLAAGTLMFTRTASAQSTITDSVQSEGLWRTYHVYLPLHYTADQELPLMISIHGYLSSGLSQESFVPELLRIADTAQFLIAYPDGLKDDKGHQYWNVGSAALPNEKNDVLFISAMIDQIHAKYKADLQHVYANGIGDGGFMCYMLAWQLSNKVTAIASVSGGMVKTQLAICNPPHAIPVMEIHGTSDISVPWGGSTTAAGVDQVMAFWRTLDGCAPWPDTLVVPNLRPSDGASAKHWVFQSEVAAITCELYQIVAGKHSTWPGSGPDNSYFNASTVMWHFFHQYKLSDFQVGVEKILEASPISFYPNPCSNTINLTNAPTGSVTISDELGRELITSSGSKIDVSRLSAGIYMMKYLSEGVWKVAKIVKVRN